jgi:hypothetical protein
MLYGINFTKAAAHFESVKRQLLTGLTVNNHNNT